MNERIKELAFEAGMHYRELCDEFCAANTDGVPFEMMERFAELVLQNYVRQIMTTEEREENIRSDEREACAALVEADGRVHPKAPDAIWAKTVAKLIRARGNHEQD
jgi:hypothetical protein